MQRLSRVVRSVIAAVGVALVAWALFGDGHWTERHVLASYCATGPVEWVLSRAARWMAGALGVVTAWWLAPAVARRLSRASPRVEVGSALRVGMAIVASLAVAELYLRHLHRELAVGGTPGARDVQLARADPRLGWSYVPSRTTWVQVRDRRVAYAIDADGDRARAIDDLPDPGRPTVLVTGESIAFGYGVAFEESFPFLVGRDLGVQTVNLAVIGYGNDQAFLRVLDALPRYERPVAVVTLFVPNQIARNVDTWRPRLALGPGDTLTAAPPSTGPRIGKLLEELPYHGDEALRVTAAILRATAEAARARGALPLFVVTNYGAPCWRDSGAECWLVDQLFVRQRLSFVRVDLDPEDRLPGLFERHPGVRGMTKIAAAVERALSGHVAMCGGVGAAPCAVSR